MRLSTLDHIDRIQRQILKNMKQPHNMKFKIGDKVQLTEDRDHLNKYKGDRGVIIEDPIGYDVCPKVRFEDGEVWKVNIDRLELSTPPITLPTASSILSAAEKNPCAKATFEALFPGVFEEANKKYDSSKIYAIVLSGHIYKLQQIGKQWRFCRLSSSDGGTLSEFNSPQEAIKYEEDNYTVHQFSTQREFLEWAMEVTG